MFRAVVRMASLCFRSEALGQAVLADPSLINVCGDERMVCSSVLSVNNYPWRSASSLARAFRAVHVSHSQADSWPGPGPVAQAAPGHARQLPDGMLGQAIPRLAVIARGNRSGSREVKAKTVRGRLKEEEHEQNTDTTPTPSPDPFSHSPRPSLPLWSYLAYTPNPMFLLPAHPLYRCTA